MEPVYILEHLHTHDDGIEDVKMIGVYSTYEMALQAIERLSTQPGFSQFPRLRLPLSEDDNEENDDGFYINKFEIDEDHWTEGFVEVP